MSGPVGYSKSAYAAQKERLKEASGTINARLRRNYYGGMQITAMGPD
jgi:hypothetical protein